MPGKQYSVLRKFSVRNIKAHRGRNLLIIAVVMCLTMLVCAMMVLSTSTYKNLERYYIQQNGNASQYTVSGIAQGNIDSVSQNASIGELGQSVCVGSAQNSAFHERPSEIRYADATYAGYMLSLPVQGRMPERENEIAVDTTVLSDLNAERTLGTTITVEWTDRDGRELCREFEVVGIWDGSDLCPVRRLWVSGEYISDPDQSCVDIAFNLKNPRESASKLKQIAQELQVSEEDITANWVYSERVQHQFVSETFVYKTGIALVLVCGFLILFNLMNISAVSDRKLYGRLKTLGSTPGQIRFVMYYQYLISVLAGVPLGLVLGYFLGSAVVPGIIISFDSELAIYADRADFILTAVLVSAVVFLAGIIPSRHACAIDPAELLSEESSMEISGKTCRQFPGLPFLFELSLTNFGRYRKRNITALALLTVGVVFSSCIYVIDHSFDTDRYVQETALSDVTITEQTLVHPWGEYDPQGETITDQLIHDLESTGGIVERGTLYSQDITIQVSEAAYRNVIAYYEADGGEKLQYMQQDAAWAAGYDHFRDTRKCTATVYGTDHLVNDKISDKERIITGVVDKEKFLSGDYAIAQGYLSDNGDDELQPAYDVGDTVVINNREFEVMAVVEAPYPVTKGKINPGAEFGMCFFIPSRDFLEMFPDNTPRKLFLNIEESKVQEMETVLASWAESGVPVETKSTLQKHYRNETRSATLLQDLVSVMILAIGVVNLINVIIVSTTERNKEFAMMQGIGMTKRQLRCLLAMEGINFSVITLFLSYFLSLVLICTAVKAYLETQWTAVFRFSILPLLALTPFLVLLPVFVAIGCFNRMQKTDIIKRLQVQEE